MAHQVRRASVKGNFLHLLRWPGFWFSVSSAFVIIGLFTFEFSVPLTIGNLLQLGFLWLASALAIFLFGSLSIEGWAKDTNQDHGHQQMLRTWTTTKSVEKENPLIQEISDYLAEKREEQKKHS